MNNAVAIFYSSRFARRVGERERAHVDFVSRGEEKREIIEGIVDPQACASEIKRRRSRERKKRFFFVHIYYVGRTRPSLSPPNDGGCRRKKLNLKKKREDRPKE